MARLIAVGGVYLACAMISLVTDSWIFLTAAWFVQALVLVGILSIVHECAHRTFVPRDLTANLVLGRVLATAIFMDFSLYRREHLLHHRHLNGAHDTEPETAFDGLADYLRFMVFNPHFVSMSKATGNAAFGRVPSDAHSPQEAAAIRDDGRLVLGWLLTIAVATAIWPMLVLQVYLVPFAVSLVLDSFFSLPEHHGLRHMGGGASGSRSVGSNAFVRFFLWNVNFHAEHHAMPGLRYDQLKRAFESGHTDGKFVSVGGYLEFHARVLLALARYRDAETGQAARPRSYWGY